MIRKSISLFTVVFVLLIASISSANMPQASGDGKCLDTEKTLKLLLSRMNTYVSALKDLSTDTAKLEEVAKAEIPVGSDFELLLKKINSNSNFGQYLSRDSKEVLSMYKKYLDCQKTK